jgi:alkanesulfonate monooxygenase SsuD/methylene tetrahydromethanopterin reductase-like flavin-dependent oxidoreductase (luciferase family)
MLGVGPGALPGDGWMQNINPSTQRQRMDEGLGVIIRLLAEEEASPVVQRGERHPDGRRENGRDEGDR